METRRWRCGSCRGHLYTTRQLCVFPECRALCCCLRSSQGHLLVHGLSPRFLVYLRQRGKQRPVLTEVVAAVIKVLGLGMARGPL